jgi:predicted transposase YdaD
METDSLFYRLFSEKPKLIFELLGEKAPRTTYNFGSYELKQTSLRSDGILLPQQRVLESIVTVFIHKFPKLSREEIKAMLGTKADLKKTRFYQEIEEEITEAAKEEVLTKALPALLQAGLSIGEAAKQLGISVKQAKAIAKQCNLDV